MAVCLPSQRCLALQDPPEATEQPPLARPTVTLLDAGAEPRRTLRYVPQVGAKDTFILTMRMNMGLTMAEQEQPKVVMPPIRFTCTAEVREITAEGYIRSDATFGRIEVLDQPGADPMMMRAMREAVEQFQAVTMTGVTSDRGETISVEMHNLDQLDPQFAEQFQMMSKWLEYVGAILPEEGVGPGGRWRVEQPMEMSGIKLSQQVEYRIVSIEGDAITLDATTTQTADAQDILIPNMEGTTIRLELMKTTGEGRMTFHLDRPASVRAEMKAQSELRFSYGLFGEWQSMLQKMDMSVTIESADAKAEEDGAPERVQEYTCSMHPTVRLTDPKAKCPICHMDLIPVPMDEDEGLGPRQIRISEDAESKTNSAAFAAEFVCILIVVSRLHIHGLHQSQVPSELR